MSLSVIFIAVTVVISLMAMNDNSLKMKLIHNPYAVVHRKEIYRVLTSGFIHADYMHLAFNMFTFFWFGPKIEDYLNSNFGDKANLYFFLIYVLGIIVANVPDLLRHKNDIYYNSLGASGGVSSILFAEILLEPIETISIFPIPIPIYGFVFAILYVWYSLYMDRKQMDNVNHQAHLWGAFWGIAFIVFLSPDAFRNCYFQILSLF